MTLINDELRVFIDAMSNSTLCRCGHSREAHQHFRKGTDCGVCGPVACPRFSAVPFWQRPKKNSDAPDSGATQAEPHDDRSLTSV